MALINFNDTPTRAFVRGFWKGMAAPLMLFSSFSVPAEVKVPEFKPLPRPRSGAGDQWLKVGEALREASHKLRQQGQ